MELNLNRGSGMRPGDLVYERVASTTASPVPATTSNYILLNWTKPNERTCLLIYALGTDQHDNSYYKWVVDGTELAINGSSRVGGIFDPLVFPEPIKCSSNIILYITNDNAVAYPNSGADPANEVPYEAVVIGKYI